MEAREFAMNEKLKSRKLWVLILTVMIIAASDKLGLDPEAITKLIGLVGAYMLGQGIADVGSNQPPAE